MAGANTTDYSGFGGASLAMQGIGALFGALNARVAAKSQKSTLEYQAMIAANNARMSELGAQSALQAGEQQEQGVRMGAARIKSAQRVGFAANGIDASSATAQNVFNTTDVMSDIDANTVHANAVRAAWGYRTQGQNYTNEANMKKATASGISPSAAVSSSLMTSASSVASNWYYLNKLGAFESSDVQQANKTDDPIQSLGKSRKWWSTE